MFHQILVRNDDRDALRFVWRDQPSNVQLFGKVDSPSIANWTVKQCVKDSNNRFSNSTEKRVLENFYMDDFLPLLVQIPRWYGCSGTSLSVQLHLFANASTNAFGAVA